MENNSIFTKFNELELIECCHFCLVMLHIIFHVMILEIFLDSSSLFFVEYIRGRSDKYLVHKRKTEILEKWRFISQHSLLLLDALDAAVLQLLYLVWKTRFLEVCKVGLRGGDNLLVRRKFLPREWLFQVWEQKK